MFRMKPRTQAIHDQLMKRFPMLQQCNDGFFKAFHSLLMITQSGGNILVCGNGGSAADAEHITAELMKGFMLKRALPEEDKEFLLARFGEDGGILSQKLQRAIPAISLVSSISMITAISNDIGSEFIFAQQVYGYCQKDSGLLAISTSGNSKNCIYAAMAARLKGCPVIALTGEASGKLGALSDVVINVPATRTHEIQELQLPIYHAMCAMLESEMFEQ